MSKTISRTEQNIETINAFNDVIFGEHDVSTIGDYVTEDFVQYDGDVVVNGVEETTEYFSGMLEAFPDVDLEINEMLADEDTVMFRCELTATNDGDITVLGEKTIPATGKSVEWGAMISTTLVDGKMAETHVFAEDLSLLTQLGLVDDVAA